MESAESGRRPNIRELAGSLRHAIGIARERDDADVRVMTSLHGHSDEVTLAADIVSTLGKLGLPTPRRVHYYRASVGAVVGVELVDGTHVALKFHNSQRYPREHLEAVYQICRHLSAFGFPCAQPQAFSPAPFPVTAERWFSAGHAAKTIDVGVQEATARALARLIRDAMPVLPEASGLRLFAPAYPPTGTPWPGSHSPLIDFDRERDGATWIEDVGRAAIDLVREADSDIPEDAWVIGHMDFGTGNLRFENGEVVAVYDWEALAKVREFVVVGQCAEPELFDEFLTAYESARGAPFSPAERRGAAATTVASLGYAARCEYALSPKDDWAESARERLRRARVAILETL